jgi:hypothetical protein
MHGLDHTEGLLEELMALVDDASDIPAMRATVATLLANAATALDMLPTHQKRLYMATANRDANPLSTVAVVDEAGQALYDFGPSESDEDYEDRQPTRHDAHRHAGMLATPSNEPDVVLAAPEAPEARLALRQVVLALLRQPPQQVHDHGRFHGLSQKPFGARPPGYMA